MSPEIRSQIGEISVQPVFEPNPCVLLFNDSGAKEENCADFCKTLKRSWKTDAAVMFDLLILLISPIASGM